MKKYILHEVQDQLIGKTGTADRDSFEYELQMDLIGKAITQTRQERQLMQEALGKLIGVQKAQISRLESDASTATIDTLMRVFGALKANVRMWNGEWRISNVGMADGECGMANVEWRMWEWRISNVGMADIECGNVECGMWNVEW